MNKSLNLVLTWVKRNKFFLLLLLFYFIFRLINLTKLPIFNDEAIYLDWGFRETHRPGNLYYSLYDAKQPFLMWIFGIMESLFSDPLFAGRLVSVFAGFFTLIGIYRLAKYLFEEKTALVSAFLYTLIPISSFYDRQALMESSIAAVGIWSAYFILKSIKDKSSLKYPIFVGIILGIGFFIKSSSLVFLAAYLVLVILQAIIFRKVKIVADFFIAFCVFLASISLLLINPQFWGTIGSNSRYTLTTSELLAFPLGKWLESFTANLQIGFYGITPLLFLTGLIGMLLILAKKDKLKIFFLGFFAFSFLLTTLVVRVPTDRYLVSFLAFLVVPAAYLILLAFNKNKVFGVFFSIIIFVVPFFLTSLQITNPVNYLLLTEKWTYFGNSAYLRGFTSGYGVDGAVSYFDGLSKQSKITVTIAENTGNPESAIIAYFNRSSNVQVAYMDGRIFGSVISSYDCLSSSIPLYFVARDEQLVGLNKFLEKVKTIKNPYGPNTIGIYGLKKNCKGKIFELRPVTT